MDLHRLKELSEGWKASPIMPVLFIGHGNPMNAIIDNDFRQTWASIGENLPVPNAIIAISAHWETRESQITAMPKPKTIHDFCGFPRELFDVQYPAPGSPELAKSVTKLVSDYTILEDHEWGLDHGTWSVLNALFPKADIPVLQLSISQNLSPAQHFDLSDQLKTLRKKGVLFIGSGNLVHNLSMIRWKENKPYDWALEFDELVKNLIKSFELKKLFNYQDLGASARLSIPTAEHFLPLFYSLGLVNKAENISFFNSSIDLGSISMRSFISN